MQIVNQCVIYLFVYHKLLVINDKILDLILTRLINCHQFNSFSKMWRKYRHYAKTCKLINYLPNVIKLDDLSIVMQFAHFIDDHISEDNQIDKDYFNVRFEPMILILYQDENLFEKLISVLNDESKWNIALWPIITINDFINIFNLMTFAKNANIIWLLRDILIYKAEMIDLKEKIIFLIDKIEDHRALLNHWNIIEFFIFNDLLDKINADYRYLI